MLNRQKMAGGAISKLQVLILSNITGFGGGGATLEDVTLMQATVGPDMGVKASGGVRSASDLKYGQGWCNTYWRLHDAIVTGGQGKGASLVIMVC